VGDQGWTVHFSPLAFRQGNMEGLIFWPTTWLGSFRGAAKFVNCAPGSTYLDDHALAHHTGRDETAFRWLRCSDEVEIIPAALLE
jgi:hypothetical protein